MKRQLNDSEEILKKRDEELDSLKQIFQSQQEMKGLKAAMQESKSSGGLPRSEESWKEEISQLKVLLAEKEHHICRVEKKRRIRTLAHIETLACWSATELPTRAPNQGGEHPNYKEVRGRAVWHVSPVGGKRRELDSMPHSRKEEIPGSKRLHHACSRSVPQSPASGELSPHFLYMRLSFFRRFLMVKSKIRCLFLHNSSTAQQWEGKAMQWREKERQDE